MKNLTTVAALVLFSAFSFSCPDADARVPQKKSVEVLDGTHVYNGQKGTSKPVESSFDAKKSFGIEPFNPTKTIYLYPKGQNCDQGIVENGETVTEGPFESNGITAPEHGEKWFISNVADSARIDIYLPEHPNGQMVIMAPGGGYSNLSVGTGMLTAKWLCSLGTACAVVKYRLPNGHRHAPLQDFQNALRYCRYHADEWGVKQIGVMGYSAGGHLAAIAETMYNDAVTKPDFSILIYPVASMEIGEKNVTRDNLIGKPEVWASRDNYSFDEWYARQEEYKSLGEMYSAYNDVTAQTPATFIALSSDDPIVPPVYSLRFYRALVNSNVSVEMHIFPKGGHGFGFNDPILGIDQKSHPDKLGECRPELTAELDRWLAQQREKIGETPRDCSAEKVEFTRKPDNVVRLYPEGQSVDKGIVENGVAVTLGPGESTGCTAAECLDKYSRQRFTGDSARIEIYLPKNPNGIMVIDCPGGAYWFTDTKGEAAFAADYLNSIGVTVAVVKYRIPFGHCTAPLTDVQNAFRYCRAHAAEWGISKIGVMGASAGGHLAASASTLYVDEITRPDFSVLLYPVISTERGVGHQDSVNNLIGSEANWDKLGVDGRKQYKELLEKYSLDKQVTADTPCTFIIYSSDDPTVPAENEIRYFNALLDHGVKCELHSFPSGKHGYGFWDMKYGSDQIAPYRQNFYSSINRFFANL